MRVSLLLEAQDKASRAVKAVAKAVTGFNASAERGATKSAAATAKATKALDASAKAAASAEKATAGLGRTATLGARGYATLANSARKAGETSRAAAQLAERAWVRLGYAIANSVTRQTVAIAKGGGDMIAGGRKAGAGLMMGGKIAAGAATGAGALGAGAALVSSQLVKPAAEAEKFQSVLETTERSAEGAKKALAWVSDFAAKTPYDLAGVTEAFVRLRTYAINPMNGTLRTLGDTAAAMDKPLMQAVEAIADAITGENERLKELGIKASKQGKYFQYAFKDDKGRQRTLKALATDQAAIEKAILYIWNNRYAGAMEKLSKTWAGMVSNMGDQFTRFQLMIMNAGLFDWMKGRLSELMATFDKMASDGTLQMWAERIAKALQRTMEIGWEAAKGFGSVLLKVAAGAERVATAIGGWDNFAWLALAVTFAQPMFYTAAGLFLFARGAIAAGIAIGKLSALLGVSAALGLFRGALRLAWLTMAGTVGAVTALGRALILFSLAALRGAFAATFLLSRAILGLPAALMAVAGATKALVLAMIRMPALLLASARGLILMAAAGLRALPGLLAGAARGVVLLAASGLRALPALLMAAARGFVMLGVAIMTTPVGWFIAGVAAIAAAAYLIYLNWDKIGPWLAEKWAQIKQAFQDGWNYIKNFDWTSLLPDWKSLLPQWKWLDIIPSITLPSFNWRALLPDWNWSDIIPSMPDWKSWFGGSGSPTPSVPAPSIDPSKLVAQAAEAQKQIETLKPAAQAAVAAASAVLSSASFHSHGVALMATLAAGIKAGAGQAVAAVRGVAQQMRDHLPHSPAKVGPLSDLDRIRFSETIAGAIRPGPAVAAARSVAAGMRAAITPAQSAMALMPAQARSGGLPIGGAGGGPVSVQVSYSPTLTVTGAGPGAESSFVAQLREHADELARMVDEAVRRRQRTEF